MLLAEGTPGAGAAGWTGGEQWHVSQVSATNKHENAQAHVPKESNNVVISKRSNLDFASVFGGSMRFDLELCGVDLYHIAALGSGQPCALICRAALVLRKK